MHLHFLIFLFVLCTNCSRYFFNLFIGFYQSYLVLKFGNALPSISRDMAQKWFWKSHDLERSRLEVKISGTIGFLDLKNIRHQSCHPKCFSSKVKVKDVFRKMVANVTHSQTSHLRTCQDIFLHFCKGPYPNYLALIFSNVLPSSNWDMAKCDFAKFLFQNKW